MTAEPISTMTEPPMEHHFLVADVVGSTELWERIPEPMHHNIRSLQRATRRAVRNHRGSVFKTLGDGSCSVFASADDALAAAVSLIELLADTNWEGDADLAVRVAVHSGEAARYGGDLLGPGINEASKLCDLAQPGEVLVSERTIELLGEPATLAFGDVREVVIPGASHPIAVRGVSPS